MDQVNDYSDVIVVSDDDDAVNSDFKDKDNLGGKEKNLMPKQEKESKKPKKKKKTRNYVKKEIDVFDEYVWTSIIELPECQVSENSTIIETTRFHCHYCVKSFPEEHLLKEHLNTHKKLGKTDKKIKCQSCGKFLRSRFKLKRRISRKACNCGVICID